MSWKSQLLYKLDNQDDEKKRNHFNFRQIMTIPVFLGNRLSLVYTLTLLALALLGIKLT